MGSNKVYHDISLGDVPEVIASQFGLTLVSKSFGLIYIGFDSLIDITPRNSERLSWLIDTGHTRFTTIQYWLTFKSADDAEKFIAAVAKAMRYYGVKISDPTPEPVPPSTASFGNSKLFPEDIDVVEDMYAVYATLYGVLGSWFGEDFADGRGDFDVDQQMFISRVLGWIPTLSKEDIIVIKNTYSLLGKRPSIPPWPSRYYVLLIVTMIVAVTCHANKLSIDIAK